MEPSKVSYDGTPPTTDYSTKAAQIRQLAAATDVINKRISDATADLHIMDPNHAAAVGESANRRLQNLNAALPQGTYRGPFLPPGPPDADQISDFNMYEAVTWNRDLAFQYVKAGSMPDSVVDAMREQHPEYLHQIMQQVMENPDMVLKAPLASQIALSKLLGVPFVPEADALYIQRHQIKYDEAKQKALLKQQSQQGASMMRGGMPAAPPMTPAQQFSSTLGVH
jgi:hypothetical protein